MKQNRTPAPRRFSGLLLAFLLLTPTTGLFAQDSFPGWHSDLDRAAEIAAKRNQPIFLVFRCVR